MWYKISLTIISLVTFIWGGAIRGNVIYQGTGVYAVLAINPDAPPDSHENAPMDTITEINPSNTSRPYEIIGDFHDTIPYTVVGILIPWREPRSGDPAGIYPYDVYTIGGVAENIDITLATSGRMGGHITYEGDISDIKINVYDLYQEPPVLENTYPVSSADYLIPNIPSGPKAVEAFADINGNDRWDEDEPIDYFEGPMEGAIFIGGGDRFATGVDFGVPFSNVSEQRETHSALWLENGKICFDVQSTGTVEVYDIAGRNLSSQQICGRGSIDIGTAPSGIYLVRTNISGKINTKVMMVIR